MYEWFLCTYFYLQKVDRGYKKRYHCQIWYRYILCICAFCKVIKYFFCSQKFVIIQQLWEFIQPFSLPFQWQKWRHVKRAKWPLFNFQHKNMHVMCQHIRSVHKSIYLTRICVRSVCNLFNAVTVHCSNSELLWALHVQARNILSHGRYIWCI